VAEAGEGAAVVVKQVHFLAFDLYRAVAVELFGRGFLAAEINVRVCAVAKRHNGGFPAAAERIAFRLGQRPAFFVDVAFTLRHDDFFRQRDVARNDVGAVLHNFYFARFFAFAHFISS
jgi:hypothetical protein